MILLIETSTDFLRLWLFDGEREVANFEKSLAREMSGRILLEIENFLGANNLEFSKISGIGVFAGPGSFTGLRIGTTVADSLADALEIPIVGAQNSDFSKTDDESSKNDWREVAISKLLSGENQKIVKIEYGRGANITQQKK